MNVHWIINGRCKCPIWATAMEPKKIYSDTGNRTPICSVRANCASHYTISDNWWLNCAGHIQELESVLDVRLHCLILFAAIGSLFAIFLFWTAEKITNFLHYLMISVNLVLVESMYKTCQVLKMALIHSFFRVVNFCELTLVYNSTEFMREMHFWFSSWHILVQVQT